MISGQCNSSGITFCNTLGPYRVNVLYFCQFIACIVIVSSSNILHVYIPIFGQGHHHNLKSVFHSKLDDNWGFLELLQNKHYKICSWGSDMVFFQYYDIRFTEIVLLNVAWWIWKLKSFVSTLLHSFACQDVFG